MAISNFKTLGACALALVVSGSATAQGSPSVKDMAECRLALDKVDIAANTLKQLKRHEYPSHPDITKYRIDYDSATVKPFGFQATALKLETGENYGYGDASLDIVSTVSAKFDTVKAAVERVHGMTCAMGQGGGCGFEMRGVIVVVSPVDANRSVIGCSYEYMVESDF